MPDPTVSILIPAYNGSKYLNACLDSVISQSFADIEVVVIDDCSTDATVQIAQKYASIDSRIRVECNKENKGLVGNWNQCISLSRGEWIKFAFQDDILDEECVEKMLRATSFPIAFCERTFRFEDGTPSEVIARYTALPSIRSLLGSGTEVPANRVTDAVLLESRNFFGEPTTALIHRSVFHDFGFFNDNLAQLCDLEYWVRVTTNTGLTFVPDKLATFRYHSSSTSANNRDKSNDEFVSIFDELIMLHEYAFNPHYENLRHFARRSRAKRNFVTELARKASWINSKALALASDPLAPDHRWIVRWNELAAQYPKIELPYQNLPHRIRKQWGRFIGWRLK